MSTTFRFLGISAFLITTATGKKILIDPFLNENDTNPFTARDFDRIDLIIVSHAAYDHFGDAAEIAKIHKCPVICGNDSKLLLLEQGVDQSQIIETVWGLAVEAAGIRVRPIMCMHRSAATLKDGRIVSGLPLSFIIYLEDGTRIYNAGDTTIFSDMKLMGELYRPHVGIMNVAIVNYGTNFLTGEMTPYEAALASQWLGFECAIACHYNDRMDPDVQEYLSLMESMRADNRSNAQAIALEPGEEFVYSR